MFLLFGWLTGCAGLALREGFLPLVPAARAVVPTCTVEDFPPPPGPPSPVINSRFTFPCLKNTANGYNTPSAAIGSSRERTS